MSQGGYVTLVGFVAREPRLREVKGGRHVAEMRVGTTTRVLDRDTGEWHDADTSYYTVNCWRRLADHVNASMRKGDPVMVKGRFKTRSYEDKAGRLRTEVEIVADAVGHDLNRGVASYIRNQRPRPGEAGDRAADERTAATAATETADAMDAADSAEDMDILDEEAIERFGRELDEGLDEAAQALDEDDPEGEAAVPGVPRVPF
jgi:single-strand DNA-binding protein